MTDQFATATDTADTSDVVLVASALSKTLTDTANISGVVSTRRPALHKAATVTVNISGVITARVARIIQVQDSIDIATAVVGYPGVHPQENTVEISAVPQIAGALIQYDTWRSIPRFDNQAYLICRTPLGGFDSDAAVADITVWTVDHDGENDRLRIGQPETNGWTTYRHPEWSPDGQEVVIAAETVTTYQLELVDSSDWVL